MLYLLLSEYDLCTHVHATAHVCSIWRWEGKFAEMGQPVHFDMGSGDPVKVNRLVCQDPLSTELSYCPHWMFCSSMQGCIEVTENTLQEETLGCKGLGPPVSYFPRLQMENRRSNWRGDLARIPSRRALSSSDSLGCAVPWGRVWMQLDTVCWLQRWWENC